MESILGRALEYTLKYWLKSFSRDQFKLQGRTVQLYNLDLNGDVLHSSVGFPPTLNVTAAKVGKLEITLPSVSNVQIEPIIVQIDRLNLVLEENFDFEPSETQSSCTPSSASTKGSGYGFADKIADGMTIQIDIVNLLLETRGSACRQGGATWTPPMASITIHNLLLYTTNESWEVVNLKEAREFSRSEGINKIFSPEKHSLDGSVCSRGGFSPVQNLTNESPSKTMETTLALLEEAVADSKAKINSLMTDVGTSESSFQHLTVVKEVSQKIESLQGLVLQLREQL